MVRQAKIFTVAAAVLTVIGVPAGLLWAAVSPAVSYVVVGGDAVPADPETQALIGTDGRFALIALVAGLLSGLGAYLAGGRNNELVLVIALAAGGTAAALIAWRTGHQIGLDAFRQQVRTAAEGRRITGPADLRALGVLTFWPLFAVGTFGLLESLDMLHRSPQSDPGDVGGPGAGEPDQIGGGELDLQAAPAGRNVDGDES